MRPLYLQGDPHHTMTTTASPVTTTLTITQPLPTATFSVALAMAQLKRQWPGIMSRHIVKSQVRQALEQIDDQFLQDFRDDHPRGRHAIIYRVGQHEVQLRDLHRGDLSVHWVDHPKLLGQGIARGIFAMDIAQQREAAQKVGRS